MFKWLKYAFRFDGIRDDEISEDSDWQWLTPMERIGIQTRFDAECAELIIKERKQIYKNINDFKKSLCA